MRYFTVVTNDSVVKVEAKDCDVKNDILMFSSNGTRYDLGYPLSNVKTFFETDEYGHRICKAESE